MQKVKDSEPDVIARKLVAVTLGGGENEIRLNHQHQDSGSDLHVEGSSCIQL